MNRHLTGVMAAFLAAVVALAAATTMLTTPPAHAAEARFLSMPKWADRGKK